MGGIAEPEVTPTTGGTGRGHRRAVRVCSVVLPFVLALLLGTASGAMMAASAPASSGASAERIKAAVEGELLERATIPFDRIDVSVDDGVVRLSGSVDNILARDDAMEAAASLRGVRAVIDQMKIVPAAVPDEQIVAEVKKALAADPAAEAFDVAVSARDGVVTLRGRVQSWAESHLAMRVAKSVRGVRAVVDVMAVDWRVPRSDADIAADVRGLLAADARIPSALIEVEVVDGVVKLSGTVGSVLERSRALARAYVNGAKHVVGDGLTVRSDRRAAAAAAKRRAAPAGQGPIGQALERALANEPYRDLGRVKVAVTAGGVVTLTGNVESLAAKRQAEWLATSTVGVLAVRNHLKVRPRTPVSDLQLLTMVNEALRRDPIVDRYSVRTRAYGGVVHLNGVVDSVGERRRAERIVAGIKGVIAVRNLLQVPDERAVTGDAELRAEIEEELYFSPLVDSDTVTVSVRDGKVTLRGLVETPAERRAAEENAREAGARMVQNDLRVKRGRVP